VLIVLHFLLSYGKGSQYARVEKRPWVPF